MLVCICVCECIMYMDSVEMKERETPNGDDHGYIIRPVKLQMHEIYGHVITVWEWDLFYIRIGGNGFGSCWIKIFESLEISEGEIYCIWMMISITSQNLSAFFTASAMMPCIKRFVHILHSMYIPLLPLSHRHLYTPRFGNDSALISILILYV